MDLPVNLPLPKLYKVRQVLEMPQVEDVPGAVRAELQRIGIANLVKPGQRIALTAGSRGVANIVAILKTTADVLKELGAKPFIVPTMGSHGGAAAESQRELLKDLGITEESTGCPILSSMEVVQLGTTADGTPVYMDKYASEADGILVVARVKPHTDFVAPIESGLFKMMTIGLGKHKGALAAHRLALTRGFDYTLPAYGNVVLSKAKIICGLTTVENAFHGTAKIRAVPREKFEEEELELIALAKRLVAQLPLDNIDILIVDEIGKDITGAGMDCKVIGRIMNRASKEPAGPNVFRIVVRDITIAAHGNATGMGRADFITRRLFDKIDFFSTYVNNVTGGSPESVRIPLICDNERQALDYAMTTIGDKDETNVRIMWIRNTLELEEVLVSEPMLAEAKANEKLQVVDGPYEFKFGEDKYLVDFFPRRIPASAH